jgi:hypothetical protein
MFNKTEAQLLAFAAKRNGFYSIECGGGRGPDGGKVSYGTRNRNAVMSLVEKGIIEITHRDSANESNRGYTVRHTVLAFKVI